MQHVVTRQARLVLARLTLAGAPVSTDELADLLWSDVLPPSWERHLSAVISKLRRTLRTTSDGGAAIVGRPGCYELRLPAGSVIDIVEAQAAVPHARELLARGLLDEAESTASASVDVARRPFLPGTDAAWVDAQRDALRTVLLQALDVVVDVALQRCDPSGLDPARDAVSIDPYREAGYVRLMQLHLALGERSAAAEVYDRCCKVFADEVNIRPTRQLEELHRKAVDTSSERLDTSSGERARGHVHTLPLAATSFVGRSEVLAEVTAALDRSRLVTLSGTGGVGKSRLALEVAHTVAGRHRDGASLCELAHVTDASAVVFALATAVGVRQRQGASMEDGLIDALAARDLFIVVDNCEHVLDAVAPLLERVARYCRAVRVLATSRERLAADGEIVIEVTPLELPEEDAAGAWAHPAPALELLNDRIADVRASFHPDERQRIALVDVARRLEGLPLALELAAARMAAMGPVEVARRLDRRFAVLDRGRRTALPRHRTLLAAVEWSYDLLDETERKVFERASVFVGGFTLDAAEAVCSVPSDVRTDDVSEAVAALVDKSMLTTDDRGSAIRYRMLETLREFGRERSSARDELAAIEESHARHYIDLAWRAEAHLRGPGEAEWIPVLEAELGNLRAAFGWAIRSGDCELAAELSAALLWFAHWRMHTEVLTWADQLVDDSSAAAGPFGPRMLAVAGDGAWRRGQLSRARTLGERAVAAAGTGTDARYGWHVLSAVAMFEGRLDDSRHASERLAVLAREAGDAFHTVVGLGNLALGQSYAGETAAALETAQASYAEAARSGSPSALAWSEYSLGEVLIGLDPEAALTHLDRAVVLAEPVAAHFISGVALLSATSVRARHGDPSTAARALIGIIDHWETAGNWRQQWITVRHAVELLVRLGNDQAAATVLGAIDTHDAANVYGADAESLAALRADLHARLGATTEDRISEGRAMSPLEVLAFTRAQLGRQLAETR